MKKIYHFKAMDINIWMIIGSYLLGLFMGIGGTILFAVMLHQKELKNMHNDIVNKE